MKDEQNLKWTKKDIAHQYKKENPSWTWKQCWKKAREIHKELNKLNSEMFRDTDRFFKMNTPFSFYYDKDNEFADKYVSGNS